MTNTQSIPHTKHSAAEEYCRSTYGRFVSGPYNGFIAGADWHKEWQEDHEAFNGRLGPADDDLDHMAKVLEIREPYAPPSDDAWRATLQATINQQAEEIKALRTSTEKLRRMLAVNMAERDELRAKCAVFETRLIDMTKIATGAA